MKYFGSVPTCFLAGLIALTAATFLYGQPQQMPGLDQKHGMSASSEKPQRTEFVGVRTARQLIHKPVEIRTGDTIGSVNDVVINPKTGRIVFVVIASGGFAGVGAKLKPVPPGALSLAFAKRGVLTLDIGPKRWKSAPRMNKERLGQLENPAVEEKIYSFYHQSWPADNSAESSELVLASQLIGESVINGEREVGRVSDLAVNLKDPKMTRAIIRPTTPGNTFAVPLNAFEVDAARNALLLNTDVRAFQQVRAENAPAASSKMAETGSPIIFTSSLQNSRAIVGLPFRN